MRNSWRSTRNWRASKEELESLNEELTTVNAQLEEKVTELALSNDDMANLPVSARMATILLDAGLRIRRFTPAASAVFNQQAGHEGRLLSDISSRVNDPGLCGRPGTGQEGARRPCCRGSLGGGQDLPAPDSALSHRRGEG
jgi:two-component system CheB/CheR fusion protein